MRKLRDASLAEVLAATPNDAATRRVTENHQPFAVWLVEGAGDLGKIRVQLPTGEFGTVAELHAQFLAWVSAPERTPEEQARYWDRYHDIKGGMHENWLRPHRAWAQATDSRRAIPPDGRLLPCNRRQDGEPPDLLGRRSLLPGLGG